mgnify:CR=1 FL=1
MTPEERASRSAAAMRAGDRAADWFGHEIVAVGPGTATLRMRVRDEHLNGHGICHGGVIFTLADTAFAYACNSYNRLVVAQHNTISYLSPGKPGATRKHTEINAAAWQGEAACSGCRRHAATDRPWTA